MPNWCDNEVHITFKNKEERDEFVKKAQCNESAVPFTFQNFVPMPECLVGTTSPHRDSEAFLQTLNKSYETSYASLKEILSSKILNDWDLGIVEGLILNLKAFEQTGYHDWYDWCVTNWGTKWDAHNPEVSYIGVDPCYVKFNFTTAWDYPISFFNKLVAMYPTAEFHFDLGSMENDTFFEAEGLEGDFYITHEYSDFREAIEDGKFGGVDNWQFLFEEEESA